MPWNTRVLVLRVIAALRACEPAWRGACVRVPEGTASLAGASVEESAGGAREARRGDDVAASQGMARASPPVQTDGGKGHRSRPAASPAPSTLPVPPGRT